MPTADEMRAVLTRYLQAVAAHDVDAVIALFAPDISVEDPVGGAPGTHVVGRDAVETFFRRGFARSSPTPTLQGPIRTTCGSEAAMAFRLGLELAGQACEVDVIDVVEFNTEGLIVRLRAFWNPQEIRPIAG